ncbi:hypothetical protein FB45DRAFT_919021 [Roridomyces roridus]|uniref:Secreted protein n=1 Tax=Roridomyces roridus TaxID=1738132 RepID=A0AAD7BRI9_9AGAR|nr:hypothetical protein FB45DRAFT_919021 [Roridomyces roridus]
MFLVSSVPLFLHILYRVQCRLARLEDPMNSKPLLQKVPLSLAVFTARPRPPSSGPEHPRLPQMFAVLPTSSETIHVRRHILIHIS